MKRQRGEPRHIKVLRTLGCSVVQAAIDIKVLQTLGMARDRPSPYGENGNQAWRGTGPRPTVNEDNFFVVTVARGPVPRDLSTSA